MTARSIGSIVDILLDSNQVPMINHSKDAEWSNQMSSSVLMKFLADSNVPVVAIDPDIRDRIIDTRNRYYTVARIVNDAINEIRFAKFDKPNSGKIPLLARIDVIEVEDFRNPDTDPDVGYDFKLMFKHRWSGWRFSIKIIVDRYSSPTMIGYTEVEFVDMPPGCDVFPCMGTNLVSDVTPNANPIKTIRLNHVSRDDSDADQSSDLIGWIGGCIKFYDIAYGRWSVR